MPQADLLPDTNRARVLRIDIDHIVSDFLQRHGGATLAPPYALDPHHAVLRQEALPDDARVLFAHVDPPPQGKDDALRAAREYILRHRTEGDGGPLGSIGEIDALIRAAIALPAARMLVVGVESAAYEPARRGEEPEHPFDYRAFAPPEKE